MTTPARMLAVATLAVMLTAGINGEAPHSTGSTRREPVAPQTPRPVALRKVRIIDGTGAPARDDQTLLMADGRIRALGPSGNVAIPADADVRDLPGHTVLPGLVMLHEHLSYGGGIDRLPFRDQQFSAPRLFLAFGVTTIRTAAGPSNTYVALNLKRAIDEGHVDGPEMFVSAGMIAANPVNRGYLLRMGTKIVRDPGEAKRHVRYWAAEGVTSIKVHEPITAWALAAVIEEAHEHGLPVLGHLRPVTCLEAARLGIDFIEHGFDRCDEDLRGPDGAVTRDPAAPQARELFRALLSAKVTMTETPISTGPLTEAELRALHPSAREYYRRSGSRPQRGATAGGAETDPARGRPGLAVAFARAGGRVVVGSDPGGVPRIPGFANHASVRLLRDELGFTQLEAIQIATLNGATALGIGDRTGTIAVGKEADLLVVRGDPSTTIADISNVEIVVSNGRMFDPRVLLAQVEGQFGWR